MPTIDVDAIERALFDDPKVRAKICRDFGIEDAGGNSRDMGRALVEALGQTAPSNHAWENTLDNAIVFRAAVRAIGSNSRNWIVFLNHEPKLRKLLADYDLASLRTRPPKQDDVAALLPGQTSKGDARAVLAWAAILGGDVAYYEGLVDLRRRIATQVGKDEAVPVVAGVLGDGAKGHHPPAGLNTWKTPGMGFVLACEFLRNLYWDVFKPDRHVARLLDRWLPAQAEAASARATELAHLIGRRNKDLRERLGIALLGARATPADRSINEVDNLVWALGKYVERKGKESDSNYIIADPK